VSEDAGLKALLREAHRGERGRGFSSTWQAAGRAAEAGPRARLAPRLAAAAAALLLLALTGVFLSRRPAPPLDLASLGDLSGPTDFLLARPRHHSPTAFLLHSPAEGLLSGVPSFEAAPSPHQKGSHP